MYVQPGGPVQMRMVWLRHAVGRGWQKTLGLAKCFVTLIWEMENEDVR